MKNIAEQIAEGLDRFYKAFQRKRVLKSLEEISATTNEDDLASATAVAALNNKLANGRVEIVANDDNSLGYKLDGADTVFPFTKRLSGNFRLNSNNAYFTIENVKNYKELSLWNGGATSWECSRIAIYGDGTLLGEITTESNAFDITKYSTIKIYGKYVRGDGNSNYVWGNYSLK